MKPFLKWAGGKRWLAQSGLLPQPAYFERYIEPFLGGGAIFFAMAPQEALVSDLNSELINLYTSIRDFPVELGKLMERHQRDHSKKHFYRVREEVPDERVEQAARTLYLNRTCWNGLYRVNLRGDFNVPIGTKSKVVDPDESFIKIANRLRGAEILCCDFTDTIGRAKSGDFLFVDPPYTVRHNENGFIKYNENIFSWADQVRLFEAVKEAANRGAAVVVTNADHGSLHELYADFEYRQLERASVLAGVAHRRGQTTEALFYANLEGLPLSQRTSSAGATVCLV